MRWSLLQCSAVEQSRAASSYCLDRGAAGLVALLCMSAFAVQCSAVVGWGGVSASAAAMHACMHACTGSTILATGPDGHMLFTIT